MLRFFLDTYRTCRRAYRFSRLTSLRLALRVVLS